MNEADKILGKISVYILNPIIGLMFSFALLYFIWGAITFIRSAPNPDKRKEGLEHIVWGTVGMAVMVSVYGIIRILDSFWRGF